MENFSSIALKLREEFEVRQTNGWPEGGHVPLLHVHGKNLA